MKIKATIAHQEVEWDTAQGMELTLPIIPGPETVNAWYMPDADISPFRVGSFVGSTALGGAVNCENITFNAHGNGTHTECVGHISKERVALHDCLKEFLFLAELITVAPEQQPNGDFVITEELLQGAVKHNHPALIIRTLPNSDDKKISRYSGTNPTYLSKEAAVWIRERGIEHLLIDTPSIDREEDGGELAAHHAFWNYPHNTRYHCTITELIYAPNTVPDGPYMLHIGVGAFDSDASPSRVVVYGLL